MSLEPDIREDWLAALRSGDYRKGTGALRQPDEGGERFCAMGVLMDTHPDVQWESRKVPTRSGVTGEVWEAIDKASEAAGPPCMDDTAPPLSFVKRLGIDHRHVSHVISVNDRTPLSFSAIAAEIENRELFT